MVTFYQKKLLEASICSIDFFTHSLCISYIFKFNLWLFLKLSLHSQENLIQILDKSQTNSTFLAWQLWNFCHLRACYHIVDITRCFPHCGNYQRFFYKIILTFLIWQSTLLIIWNFSSIEPRDLRTRLKLWHHKYDILLILF